MTPAPDVSFHEVVMPAEGESPRAGTQSPDLRPRLAALGTGYFAGAKLRHDSDAARQVITPTGLPWSQPSIAATMPA